MLKELLNDGIEIEIRQVPGEQKSKSIREHVRRKIIMLVQAILN